MISAHNPFGISPASDLQIETQLRFPKKSALPKYPKPMMAEVNDRISALERWLTFNGLTMTWEEALADFRSHVQLGITSPFYVQKYKDCGDIIQSAWLLDQALAKLHAYKPEDYVTEGHKAVIGRHARAGRVGEENSKAEKMLRQLGYDDAPRGSGKGQKGWIKEHVMAECSLSERTVKTIIKQMRKGKKPLP